MEEQTEYELLRDVIVERLNPGDDDIAEVAILINAVDAIAGYVEDLSCTCPPDVDDSYEMCPRCDVLGRCGNERLER